MNDSPLNPAHYGLTVCKPYNHLHSPARSLNSTDNFPRWPFWLCFDGGGACNTAQQIPQAIRKSAAISRR